jgi:acylglycerol lipase
MGGALVLAYATRQPRPPGVAKLAGIVASAPLIEQSPGVKANGLLIRAGSIIGSVLPSLQLKAGVASTDICRDPAVVEAYAADPLCPPIGSVRDHTYSEEDPLNPHVAQYRGVADMLLGGQKLIKEVSRWPDNLPILIYHGTDDRVRRPRRCFESPLSCGAQITHFDGTKRLFDNIPDSVQDKTFTPYEGYYHEVRLIRRFTPAIERIAHSCTMRYRDAHLGQRLLTRAQPGEEKWVPIKEVEVRGISE